MKLRSPLRAYKTVDRLYLHYDKKMIRRNLALMPGLSQRSRRADLLMESGVTFV